MGIFDSLFSTTSMGPGGWETTVNPGTPDWLKAGAKAGIGSAVQSPFFGGGSKTASTSNPAAPAAAAPQMNIEAALAALNAAPGGKQKQPPGKNQIYGPFGPG